jgi:L-ascorbate metabolism protein UlaG (beta-lactamase superfamily)
MLLAILLLGAAAAVASPAIEARFIGNSGFDISDGHTTLLVDFPYRSGAYGYMAFDSAELSAREHALCLFTHRHEDHFDTEAIADIDCTVLGPPGVMERVKGSARLEGGPPWRFRNLELDCLTTEHGGVDHCSWVVGWHERVLVFAGDVENLRGILPHLDQPDVLVVPYWLTAEVELARQRFPEMKVFLSHHRSGEEFSVCAGCVVPAQDTSLDW